MVPAFQVEFILSLDAAGDFLAYIKNVSKKPFIKFWEQAMTVQYFASTFTTSSLSDFVLTADQQQPIRFFPSDLGYEFSEEVLASFMTAPIPADLMDQPVSPISPDEFETAYTWFIS